VSESGCATHCTIARVPAVPPRHRQDRSLRNTEDTDTIDDFQSAVTRLKEAGTPEARVEARQQEDNQHLWQYALALMAIMLGAEAVVASRTG